MYSLETSEENIKIDSQNENSDGKTSIDGATVWAFVKMVIVLLVVVACIYGMFVLFKRNSISDSGSDPFLRKVSGISLSPGKSVQIVTLLDKAYLIGVTDNSITLLGEVDDKELVDSMNVYSDKNSKVSRPRTFSDVLDLFMSHGKNSGSVFSSGAESAADILKRQRENFNKSDRGE
ncbi:MAG: flagellar biosynthetic protein FliO [Treponema sp.]|nr:flagellar biosynthetic protein FliO [Treponema sp.]MBR6914471.1 flagellar biosynthetic protein FliO [Treponema sp.]